MAESEITLMSLVMFSSIIVYLACGIIMLRAKEMDEKKKKAFGWLLLAMSIINFVLFNSFSLKLVKPAEFASVILFLIIPFGEGMTLLVLKAFSDKLKKAFGMLLIALFLVWLAMTILSF